MTPAISTAMSPAEFEAAVVADGFDAPVPVERDASYALGEHSHPFHARALIVEGEITLGVAGTARTYRPGEIFDLPPGTPHDERAGPNGVRYLSGRRQVTA